MNRNGFLLGVVATGSQVLLLRELVSSLHGDEVFIGTALFGWLGWGAAGAYLAGRRRMDVPPRGLFALAAIVLPVTLILIRLAPRALTGQVGELVSFSHAAVLSILVVLPPAILCGWLFTACARAGDDSSHGIVRVYLWEGLGAFASGVVITLLAGHLTSNLSIAFALSAAILCAIMPWRRLAAGVRATVLLVAVATAAVLAIRVGPAVDRRVDAQRYRPYEVLAAFDTPYSHETLLQHEGVLVHMSDNTVEAVYPDLQAAENLLLPPLAYVAGAERVLLVGRPECHVGTLAAELPELSLTSVDPRWRLDAEFEARLPVPARLQRLHDDPLAHLRSVAPSTYDIVILPLGESGSYRSCRLLDLAALSAAQRALKPGGVLHVVTNYDTDRYVTEENARVLSVIYATLNSVFARTLVWPGDRTLFLAGDSSLADLSVDSITGRLARLPYRPQFISEDYLFDRLGSWRIERLLADVRAPSASHSIERPILASLQTAYRSKAHKIDRWLVTLMIDRKIWLAVVPLAILLALLVSLRGRQSPRRVGLMIYLTAGLVSLGLELLSFYVFQSTTGSLYSDLALLIGAFMLGLAVGTWSAVRTTQRYFEQGTFVLLIAATLIFAATCLDVPAAYALAYHALFQFSVALCTGGLFVVATRRHYRGEAANRGLGYACELGGSALGALLMTSILLPAIGLQPLLLALAGLAAVVMVGGLLARPQ